VNDDLAVCIVLGNEACDLDSAVSALAYARFLNQSQKHCTINIPVINVTRSDFLLKTEVVHFLGKFGINFNNLIFR
jgi:exopolyphosphatase